MDIILSSAKYIILYIRVVSVTENKFQKIY